MRILETVQKEKTQIEIQINTKSMTFSLRVFASRFKWMRAGKNIASGAHKTAPTRPRNLSILLPKQIARTIATMQTIKREKFYAQYSVLFLFFRHPQSKVSTAVFVGLITIG